MASIEHMQLQAEAAKRLNTLNSAFISYCNSLTIDKKDFDTAKELENFENSSNEGLEYKAAIGNLRKFERENNL
jgi:hypothetical protein